MSETVVRVDLRQATLSESARLRELGDRLFLAIDNPPPVRSLLTLRAGKDISVFEVARVIEVVDETESARGCYGQRVDTDRLVEQNKVGSEHLEPGPSGGAGVPAPVVIMNTAEMMLSDASEDAEALAAAVARASAYDDDDSEDSDDSDDSDGYDDRESEGAEPESDSDTSQSDQDDDQDDDESSPN